MFLHKIDNITNKAQLDSQNNEHIMPLLINKYMLHNLQIM
jgi:hypothetical protein